MVVRVWRGKSRAVGAATYERFLQETAYPDYGGVTGNRGWMLLRRPLDDAVEFMFVSFWESMDAVAGYSEGDPSRPKYYPEDRATADTPGATTSARGSAWRTCSRRACESLICSRSAGDQIRVPKPLGVVQKRDHGRGDAKYAHIEAMTRPPSG